MKMINCLKEFLRNKADERELQEGFKVEHYAFWAMFLTTAAMVILPIDFFNNGKLGLIIVLLEGALISIIGYYKAGIWGYNEKQPTTAGNLFWSILFAAISTIAVGIHLYNNFKGSDSYDVLVLAGIIAGFLVFMIIFLFLLLTFLGYLMNKRREKMDEEFLDDEK